MSSSKSLEKRRSLASPREGEESSFGPGPVQHHKVVRVRPRPLRGLRGLYEQSMLQVCLLGFVCFLCPGMFNALSGMGGAGLSDPSAAVKSNIALYSVFSGFSFVSGSVHNLIGSKVTLFLGSLGYCLYTGSYLSYNINGNTNFVIAAGAMLGLCASLLWTAQGAMMLSYPTESNKGKAIATFWVIFNLGGVIGSAVEMGLGWNVTANTVSNSTYIAFVVITAAGAFMTLLLRDPRRIFRSDGTRVVPPKPLPWYQEGLGMVRVLIRDPWILLLVPLSLASNYCYAWQQTVFNGYFFSLRSRGLNSLLYWLAQMVGAVAIGLVLDSPLMKRRSRAWVGWALAMVACFVVWGAAYHVLMLFQEDYAKDGLTLRQYADDKSRTGLDIHCGHNPVPCTNNPWRGSNPYAGRAILYLCMGLIDAFNQVYSYSLFGMLSNDISKLAYVTGLYKAVQSAGNVAGWGMENNKRPFETQLGVAWGLNVGGLLFVVPLLIWRVTNHTTLERELNDDLIVDAAAEPVPEGEDDHDNDW